MAIRLARIVAAHRADIPIWAAWGRRLVRRAGGVASFRHGGHPTTYVMHSFIDAAHVRPAWAALKRGERLDDPQLRAAQERLEACAYAMGHPETGEIVPACVQHSLLDPAANSELAVLLPRVRRRAGEVLRAANVLTLTGLIVGDACAPDMHIEDAASR